MAKRAGMEYMKGYAAGYKPPSGSAGAEAHGEYAKMGYNTRPVPEKGSQIREGMDMGNNGDRRKMMGLQREQMGRENYRGKGC